MKFSAQTAEQAIEKGLQELGKTREEVEIVIVSEGKKGLEESRLRSKLRLRKRNVLKKKLRP